MEDILIHPGFPKCASSWLQNKVFLSKNGFVTPWNNMDNIAIEQFSWTNVKQFEPEIIRESFFKAKEKTDHKNKISVISHETLIGDPIRANYWAFEVAERIAETFPEAKILISVREQLSFIYSAWGEYIRRGGIWDIKHFAPIKEKKGYRSICPNFFLKYDEIVEHYCDLFGKDNVICLPLEELIVNPADYVKKLAIFLHNDKVLTIPKDKVYGGLGGVSLQIKQVLNHFSPLDPTGVENEKKRKFINSFIRRLDKHIPDQLHKNATNKIKALLFESLKDRYAESNNRLQSYVSANLRALGYDLK